MDDSTSTRQEERPLGFQGVKAYILENKYSSALWLLRLYVVISAFFYIIPLLGLAFSVTSYKRILLGAATAYALRLHQRLPRFSFSREYLSSLIQEDSFHYLLYCLLFLTASPATLIIAPLVLFSILHAATFTRKVLGEFSRTSWVVNTMDLGLAKIEDRQSQQLILQLIASIEMMLMPASLLMLLSGQGSLMIPFFYYRFLQMRYASRRNPYSRLIFSQTRTNVEYLAHHQRCPAIAKTALLGLISVALKLAPATAPAAQ